MKIARPKQLSILLFVIVVVILGVLLVSHRADAPELAKPAVTEIKTPEIKKNEPLVFNKKQFSTEDPASPWIVVNKRRPLQSTYSPANMKSIAGTQLQIPVITALNQMLEMAQANGAPLKVISGYRSYAVQENLYSSYVKKDGVAEADTYSARPGHSEHQTGLAVDLGNTNGSCDLEACFGSTVGGKWIAMHAYEYGFIVRYMPNTTGITGYQAEAWHLRYVGPELAKELQDKNQTIEQFFGLPAAPTY